jgi:wyosine [tRNA(Phe)-imidazoG37] synthetase (radical SAM superfamily)
MPSLDAGDEQTFRKINRPNRDINIKNVVSGLCQFRKEFDGQIWLEVFFIESINTGDEQIASIKKAIELIKPDKIHLNTAVRPTAEANIKRLNAEHLQAIAERLGPHCEVIADFSKTRGTLSSSIDSQETFTPHKKRSSTASALLSMLKRRPCSLSDICAGLDIKPNDALKHIHDLQEGGFILIERKDGNVFFKSSVG